MLKLQQSNIKLAYTYKLTHMLVFKWSRYTIIKLRLLTLDDFNGLTLL
jgi:hypothetical protein